ncbi:MAG TPA: hypothetical protein VFL82_04825 [Thermomicrobiales bacterium]|nr:hypothetical protein [Thermomicrobiales bacterium]
MPPTITFVHTSPAHIPTFDALLTELAPDITAHHVADSSLLNEACAHGHVTPELAERIQHVVREAAPDGEGIVLCTCSSIAPAALGAADPGRLTVLRVDAPMAREAVRLGPRITVAATLQTTLNPTRDLILAAAEEMGKEVELTELLCASAWQKFEAGDRDGYVREVADQLTQAATATDVIVLAQASMAAAAALCPDLPVPILTSPRSGVEAAIAACRELDAAASSVR